MTFVVTGEAIGELEKGRRKRERERLGQAEASEAATGAHAMAEGHLTVMEAEGEGAEKAYRDRGATEGPGHPMRPGELEAAGLHRPYLTDGHAADAPGNWPSSDGGPAPGMRHADLTGSQARGVLIPAHVQASMGPAGGSQ